MDDDREQTLAGWLERTVIGREDEPLGRITELYLDDETGAPKWGLLSSAERPEDPPFVPLTDVEDSGSVLRLTVDRRAAMASPRLEARDGELTPEQEAELDRHYAGYRAPSPVEEARPLELDPAGEQPVMIRSEEELVVTKTAVPRERVRFVKRIVTETVTHTVEVRREELHVERLPVEAATESAPLGEAIDTTARPEPFTEDVTEVVLMEEEVVITKRVVPRERVRLVIDAVVEHQPISAEVRVERVELERDGTTP